MSELFIKKLFLISASIAVLAIGVSGSYYLIAKTRAVIYSQPLVLKPTITTSLSPVVNPASSVMPSPTLASNKVLNAQTQIANPSVRALNDAAYLVNESSQEIKEDFKKRHGLDQNAQDTDIIRYLALMFDKDPAKMAQAEAQIQSEKQDTVNSAPRQIFCNSETYGSMTTTNCF